MFSLSDLFAQVDRAKDEIIRLQQELVRIPTVNTGFMPTGNETEACRFIDQRLNKEGIVGEILESAPNRGNYIAKLHGTGGGPTVMYMAHTDVVPVEAENEWICPPFSGEIVGTRLYGRGASDCKALLTCELIATSILQRNGIRLKGDLLLAFCADEEAGGKYGVGWLVKNYPDKIKADFCINEGGGDTIRRGKGAPAYLFGIGEKGRLELHIYVKGVPSHGSMPWYGDNALIKSSRVLQRLEEYQPDIDVSAELFRYLKSLGVDEEVTLENVDRIADGLAPQNKQLSVMVRGLSRMTITPTMITAGVKANSVPALTHITCDVRILPHQDEEYLRKEIDKILNGIPDVRYELDYTAVPSMAPYATDFAAKIRSATEKALDGSEAVWVPAFTTGFTDSRFLRPLGTLTYGFQVAHPEDEVEKANIHGTNESVDVRSLVLGTKMLVVLAIDVLG